MTTRKDRNGLDRHASPRSGPGRHAQAVELADRAGLALDHLEPRRLLASDPISTDHELWAVVKTDQTITLDGVLSESAWDSATTIRRSEPYRYDSSAVTRLLYTTAGLYVSVEMTDDRLWTDGRGAGVALRYELETDDSMTFYFDPNNSRDEYFQDSDRAFGVNLGNPTDPVLGAGRIKLLKYIKGQSPGVAVDVNPGGSLATGLDWFTKLSGTVNNNADVDVGWVSEFFFPWASLNMSAPTNGQTMGMNFDYIFDNEGGQRDLTDNRDTADRWTKATFVDDHLVGAHSSYAATLGGLRGPINYAEVMFIDPSAASKPSAISNLSVTRTTGYAADLSFTAPAGVAGTTPAANKGHVSSYLVRYSTSAIATEADWLGATVYQNAFVPRLAGKTETLRFIGLSPSTTYHVAVRGVDAAGNVGPISNSASFTTKSTTQDVSGGERVTVSPMGRTLARENGQDFVMVGDHLGLTWKYTRTLYTGDVWNFGNATFIDFSQTGIAYEGVADPYLDELQAHGVNTMRVYIELLNAYDGVSKPPQYGFSPNGLHWIEWRNPGQATQYNDDMRQFMLNILREAHERGMHIIFSTQDTFSADETFLTEFPWSVVRGNPITNINNFFQTNGVLELAKARHDQLIAWLNTPTFAPYAHRLIGWEPMSEWESYEWTLNAEGDPRPNDTNITNQNWGREDEMRRRSVWIGDLGEYIKQQDPGRLVLMSTIVQDPRGPVARAVFNDRTFDVQTSHLYTNANEEPINNPDQDIRVRAAVEQANLTAYWTNSDPARRPFINGEWGMTRVDWLNSTGQLPRYGTNFTQQEDEALYRTVIWAGLASGQVGTAMRISTEELNFAISGPPGATQGYLLTDAMRDSQKTFSNFVNGTTLNLDWANFNYRHLNADMSVTFAQGKTVKSVKRWGVTDGRQGVVYAIHDKNLTSGTVSGATITIDGLRADQIVDVEVWSTAAGSAAPVTTIPGVFVGSGSLSIALPDFTDDIAIKFKARATSGQTQRLASADAGGKLVTFYLDAGMQPVARIYDPTANTTVTQDISAIAKFTGKVNDMVAFTYVDTALNTEFINLAVTDDKGNLWLFAGVLSNGTWAVRNLTAELDVPGITGDLTYYTPRWGTLQISGIDARGHSVNYYYQPGASSQWAFADLTDLIGGLPFTKGLAGFVTPWYAISGGQFDDALNIAGLNDQGEVIVYYWAPGFQWNVLNMTELFNGATLTGQLGAFVTPWGAMNIVGQTPGGAVYAYWWAPVNGAGNWLTVDLSAAAGQGPVANAVEAAFSDDGGINMFGVEADGDPVVIRWTLSDQNWRATNLRQASSGPTVRFPVSASAYNKTLQLAARASDTSGKTLTLFRLNTDTNVWTAETTNVLPEV